ncbi:MAG: biotin/lipoyl-containing protein [Anaerolineales bacterium]
MKYKVKVDNKIYEVELNDLHSQPIIALVDGEPIEVWLESEMGMKPYFAQPGLASQVTNIPRQEPGAAPAERRGGADARSNTLTAPIPGVVIAVMVSAGESVSSGQPLLVLEAMKMKNTLRSPQDALISKVNVLPGQTVQYQDVLLEFSEM